MKFYINETTGNVYFDVKSDATNRYITILAEEIK